MRTGTHYFPRGVNAVAAVERSRQKFGLNKIEETAGESVCANSQASSTSENNHNIVSNHRRTESCDLSHRRQSTGILSSSTTTTTTNNNCNGSGAPILPKEMCNLLQANTQSRMSPDLQRHLALQTYKGFECKSINKLAIFCPRRERKHGKVNETTYIHFLRFFLSFFFTY